jgi:hypothetical protein
MSEAVRPSWGEQVMSEPTSASHWLLVQLLPVVQRCLPSLVYCGVVVEQDDEILLSLRARDLNGSWLPAWDLNIEVYPSGLIPSLLLERPQFPHFPMLWQGQQAVWMDPASGEKVNRPDQGEALEAIARKLRDLLL